MPPARDSEAFPVEGGASGAAAAFDGNHSRSILSWIIPGENWNDRSVADALDELMEWTVAGHLAWVIFPPYGFRIR